jgi:hypothetical protein
VRNLNGSQKGNVYFSRQEEQLQSAINKTNGKSKSQVKTLGYGGDCCDFRLFLYFMI